MESEMNQIAGLKILHAAASTNPIQRMGLVLDHLVSALGEDPSAPLRRAQILVDIDAHPGTTQSEIMDRLAISKSTMNREIEWLYDHGCIVRQMSFSRGADGRAVPLETLGYAKRNLELALDYADHSYNNLQNFLECIIRMFTDPKPTLRDAKILVAAADLGEASRQELFARSYDRPPTTNARALDSLMEQGLLVSKSEE